MVLQKVLHSDSIFGSPENCVVKASQKNHFL